MSQFWAVEKPEETTIATTEDNRCEEWFKQMITCNTAGRFSVVLPYKFRIALKRDRLTSSFQDAGAIGLGSSRTLALGRLWSVV